MTTQQREVRVAVATWPHADLEIRASDDGMAFSGYAAVFNSDSEPMVGIGVERIAPGAFRKSLRENRDIKMFHNHNMDIVLASLSGGTLRLSEDDTGLLSDANLPDNEWGRPMADAIRRRDVTSMSFGFMAVRAKEGDPGKFWEPSEETKDYPQRLIVEARLYEVSPVTGWPAYKATSASVRHLADELGEDPEPLEDAMRVLLAADQKLTPEQRDLLIRALNARTDVPVVGGALAEWRERFAAKGYAA